MASLTDNIRSSVAGAINTLGQKAKLPKASFVPGGDLSNYINPVKPAYAASTRDAIGMSKVPAPMAKNNLPSASSPSWGGGGVLGAATTTKTTSSKQSSSNPNVSSYFDQQLNLAKQSSKNSQDMNDSEYEAAMKEGQQRLKYAQEQQQQGMAQLLSALEGVKTTIGQSKENAQTGYENDVQSLSDTAQQVERKNRNTLRALGILGSSAAGDILSRPWQEFDKQKATAGTNLQQTMASLDQSLNEKTQEHANLVADLNSKYAQLVDSINGDLAYTARERRAAKQQADLAYQQNLQEIRNAQLNYEMQIGAAKDSLASYNGGVDLGGINGTAADAGSTNGSVLGASITPEDLRKRTDTGMIPGSGMDERYQVNPYNYASLSN